MAILGMALGILYKAVSGATRNVRTDEKYAYGVELARSLLANHAMVPVSGLRDQGETEGEFKWEVVAEPAAIERGLPPGILQVITVSVSWRDGEKHRELRLDSIVEGRLE